MLHFALERAKEEKNLSVRQAAKQLGYKQAAVLSHMASGRAPIPIEKADEFARFFEMNSADFLMAVLHQRHPQVRWSLITNQPARTDSFAAQLEIIFDAPLASLNSEQRRVIREVVAEPKPARRWLSIHELPAVVTMRKTSQERSEKAERDREVDEVLAELAEEDRKRSN
jgi:hypothetical protein|tara:strand:- start:16658 stop:17167 length:510 start_codon:yes stop_codon:yes gene_type:complete